MHSLTINIDDSIYSNFKSLLELLPKDKAVVVEDEIINEPNGDTIRAMREARDGENLTSYASASDMFRKLTNC